MTSKIEQQVDENLIGQVLAEPILDKNGQILINSDVKISEKHVNVLSNMNVECVTVVERKMLSEKELAKLKQKTHKIIEYKFKYFEEGKKKDALKSLFFKFAMREYRE